MKLVKWQGLGNDYLVVEESALPAALTPAAIVVLCYRHLGVGADGILLHACPTGAIPGALARMRIFNPDGSESEMCGNGIRIFARYLARSGQVDREEFVIETLAGPIVPRLLDNERVRVHMGKARFRSANVAPEASLPAGSATVPEGDVVGALLHAGSRQYRFTFVDVGNPHCVIVVDDPASFDVAGVGSVIERLPLFPNRVNVEFIRVEADGAVRMRVWERGAGETRACGTGATAVGAACVRLGLAKSPVLVRLPGGDLTIEVEPDEAGAAASVGDGGMASSAVRATAELSTSPGLRVFMSGPAEEVFTCDLANDLLRRLGWSAPAPSERRRILGVSNDRRDTVRLNEQRGG